jgi:ribonuclease HI
MTRPARRDQVLFAVFQGRIPGIYTTLAEANKQIVGYPGAMLCRCTNDTDAQRYVRIGPAASVSQYAASLASTPPENEQVGDSRAAGGGPELPGVVVRVSRFAPYGAGKRAATKAATPKPGQVTLPWGEFAYAHVNLKLALPRMLPGAPTDRWSGAIYTDGSGHDAAKSTAHAGYGVYFCDSHPLNESAPVTVPPYTGNRGEMLAILRALQKVRDHPDVLSVDTSTTQIAIWSDSEYSVKSVIYGRGVRSRGWVTATGKPIASRDIIEPLVALYWDVFEGRVALLWTEAHCDNYPNDRADQLAKSGAKMRFDPSTAHIPL